MKRSLALARSMAGLLMLAACGASGAQQASAPLKPEPTATAFLDRPQSLAAARKSGVPVPVLVLLERNPWMMVIGADSRALRSMKMEP
jgi:hypothetical protein